MPFCNVRIAESIDIKPFLQIPKKRSDNMSERFKRKTRLNTPQDIRRMLARVINMLLLENEGEMSIDKAKTIATLSNTILKSMELGDLAERLDQIEEVLNTQKEGD